MAAAIWFTSRGLHERLGIHTREPRESTPPGHPADLHAYHADEQNAAEESGAGTDPSRRTLTVSPSSNGRSNEKPWEPQPPGFLNMSLRRAGADVRAWQRDG
jgi:hypothetical protein